MESMPISQFKSTCLAVLERVRKTGLPVMITKRGKPVARIVPPRVRSTDGRSAHGCMAGTAREVGDIVEPLSPEDWEALR